MIDAILSEPHGSTSVFHSSSSTFLHSHSSVHPHPQIVFPFLFQRLRGLLKYDSYLFLPFRPLSSLSGTFPPFVEDDKTSNGFMAVAGQEKSQRKRGGVDSGVLSGVLLCVGTSSFLLEMLY